MKNSKPPIQEVDGSPLIEDVNKLKFLALGEGPGFCHGCGAVLREGEQATAYVFRLCCHSGWLVGQSRCSEHAVSLVSLSTLGVREAVVTGRVGRCVDQGRQCDWRVLLDLEVLEVSSANSKSVFDASEVGASADCSCVSTAPAASCDVLTVMEVR